MTKTQKHYIQESQEVSPFPAGDQVTGNTAKQTCNTNNKKDPQKHHHVTVSKRKYWLSKNILTGGLKHI